MEVRRGFALPVTDPSGAGEARRRVAALCRALGFGETEAGRAALAATELATNLARHADGGGAVVVRPCGRGGAHGVEMLALDRGPGMRNAAECLRDGFSTAGTAGTGLGALQRVSDEFDLFSTPGRGTVVLARVWGTAPPPPADPLDVAGVAVAKPGQDVCGDGWAAAAGPGGCTWLLAADGLGHGPDAFAAAEAALRAFDGAVGLPPEEVLARIHPALRGTRGAAVSVAAVDAAARTVRFAGIGNVAGHVWAPGGGRSMVTLNGIVGHEMRKVQAFDYPLADDGLVLLHTDGVSQRWMLEAYPGLALRDPAVIATVLYRDFARGTDDATVVVARERRP